MLLHVTQHTSHGPTRVSARTFVDTGSARLICPPLGLGCYVRSLFLFPSFIANNLHAYMLVYRGSPGSLEGTVEWRECTVYAYSGFR